MCAAAVGRVILLYNSITYKERATPPIGGTALHDSGVKTVQWRKREGHDSYQEVEVYIYICVCMWQVFVLKLWHCCGVVWSTYVFWQWVVVQLKLEELTKLVLRSKLSFESGGLFRDDVG